MKQANDEQTAGLTSRIEPLPVDVARNPALVLELEHEVATDLGAWPKLLDAGQAGLRRSAALALKLGGEAVQARSLVLVQTAVHASVVLAVALLVRVLRTYSTRSLQRQKVRNALMIRFKQELTEK